MELAKEPINPEQIRRLVDRDDAVVVEVGANNGGHSRMFLKTFPDGQVHCFEPDPRCIKKWRAGTKDARATLYECAVGDEDGEVTFHLSDGRETEGFPEGWDSSSSLLPPTSTKFKRWPWLRFERKLTVPCVKLDTWFLSSGLERIDFLWADVQGAEALLISGAKTALSKTRYLYTEYGRDQYYQGQPSLDELLSLVPEFEVVSLWKDDVLLRRSRYANLR